VLSVADRQRGFFDAAWCSDLLPEDSIYSLLAQHGDRIVRDEDFADCYSGRRGRPSIPPSLLAKVLLLAYREGLFDERAMEAVRFDLRWKLALDLPVDHPGFHPTSLVRFRARLLLHGMERLVFERSLELASELGLIEGEAEQIVDSTPMLGAAAVQDTVTLVRSGVRRLLDAVQASDAEAAAELGAGLRFDYSRPRVKPEGDWHDKAARMELLAAVAKDAVRALKAVEEDDELIAAHEVAEAVGLLREIVGQEFEVEDDEVPRPRRGRRTRQVVSAHDPEMRHGRTTPSKRFTGYKLHAAAAVEAPLLTAISVWPANEHDGHHAGALVDQQPERRRPKRLIGDTATATSRPASCSKSARSRFSRRSTAPRPRRGRSPRTSSRSTSTPTPSPARAERRRRSTSPDETARAPPASGSPASREPTANPARSGRAARRLASATSASGAARTCARPRCGSYPTPPSATTSSAPDR
jgi:transposase